MKLSVRGEYALRALLVLGLHYDEPLVRIQAISDEQNIPKRFLEQILNDLKSAGLVKSKRGVAGGYRLAQKPDQITVASVVRHIEGALAPVSCASDRFYEKCSCPDESRCRDSFEPRWRGVHVARGQQKGHERSRHSVTWEGHFGLDPELFGER